MISLVIEAETQYSASAEDRDIVVCFMECQETKESPKKNAKASD